MNEKQMQDMAVSILLDEYTQLDVAQLLKEYEEAEENSEIPNTSDTLDEACNRMIRREFTKKKQKKFFIGISKALSRVAMVTLMLIGLCTVSVLSVKAWREPVLRFVLETFDRYTTVGMEGEISQRSKTPEEVLERLAEIVPKDYVMIQKSIQDGQYWIKYAGEDTRTIRLFITTYQHQTYFDTESTEDDSVWINGHEVIFTSKNSYRAMWLDENNELLYDLRASNLSEKTFWDIVCLLTQ